jgi:serine/threonine-protein kinase
MPDLRGEVLRGQYEIETLVQRGSLADLYKAWDSQRRMHVAVKVFRDEKPTGIPSGRHIREDTAVLAALMHPNIVRFLGYERQGSRSFVVSEWVDGVTLQGRLAEAQGAPLPLDETGSILNQVFAALQYAHGKNVLHGNIQPDKLLIQPDGKVLVAGFGVAGAGRYTSPEQKRGEELDARSDIYSLAIVIYEMLTGKHPFPPGDSRSSAAGLSDEPGWRKVQEGLTPLRELDPELSQDVERAVLRALAENPDERWSMMITFAVALYQLTELKPPQPGSEPGLKLVPQVVGVEQRSQLRSGVTPKRQNVFPVGTTMPAGRWKRQPFVQALVSLALAFIVIIMLVRPGSGDRLTPTVVSTLDSSGQTVVPPTWTPSPRPAPTRTPYRVIILDKLFDYPVATVLDPVADLWATPESEGEPDDLQTQLVMGERLIIKGETRDGYWVAAVDQPSSKDIHGYPGWVRASALVPGVADADLYAVVMVPQAAVRAEPDSAAAVLTWLYLDSRLPGLGWNEGWLQLRLPDGQTGWVAGSDVRTTEDLDLPAARAEVLNTAIALLGTPYRWGGATSGACDCSGFVFRVFHAHGIAVARDSQDQAHGGSAAASRESLRPGDLIFTSQEEGSPISHVGIFMGDDQMVDCGLNGVRLRSLNELLLDRSWKGARTYLR